MNTMRILYLDKIIQRAKSHAENGEIDLSWKLLEDAHIYAQPYPGQHTYVHWEMLLLALTQWKIKEICGQVIRLILAAPGSITGKYPPGNTGRCNVSMFLPMDIPKRIEDKLRQLDKEEIQRIKDGGVLQKKTAPIMISRKRK